MEQGRMNMHLNRGWLVKADRESRGLREKWYLDRSAEDEGWLPISIPGAICNVGRGCSEGWLSVSFENALAIGAGQRA